MLQQAIDMLNVIVEKLKALDLVLSCSWIGQSGPHSGPASSSKGHGQLSCRHTTRVISPTCVMRSGAHTLIAVAGKESISSKGCWKSGPALSHPCYWSQLSRRRCSSPFGAVVKCGTSSPMPRSLGPVLPWPPVVTQSKDINTDPTYRMATDPDMALNHS